MLLLLGRYDQAFEVYDAAFTAAVKSQGPRGENIPVMLNEYWNKLHMVRGPAAGEQLKQRAGSMGCDVARACVSVERYMRDLLSAYARGELAGPM